MPKGPQTIVAVRILTATCVALAAMCAVLAWAWSQAREDAVCWRLAAEFQRPLDTACRR
jgi:hypothetical protein